MWTFMLYPPLAGANQQADVKGAIAIRFA